MRDNPAASESDPAVGVRRYKGSGWAQDQFLWGPGFPVMNKRIVRRVFSLFWVVLGERQAVIGENCLQEGEGPFIEGECLVVPGEEG